MIISLKMMNVLGKDVNVPPIININDYEMVVVNQFIYLASTISSDLTLDTAIGKRNWKAATTFARFTTRVRENSKISFKTNITVYNVWVIRTLLHGSEIWTTYVE